jgi:hypothetical protein
MAQRLKGIGVNFGDGSWRPRENANLVDRKVQVEEIAEDAPTEPLHGLPARLDSDAHGISAGGLEIVAPSECYAEVGTLSGPLASPLQVGSSQDRFLAYPRTPEPKGYRPYEIPSSQVNRKFSRARRFTRLVGIRISSLMSPLPTSWWRPLPPKVGSPDSLKESESQPYRKSHDTLQVRSSGWINIWNVFPVQ